VYNPSFLKKLKIIVLIVASYPWIQKLESHWDTQNKTLAKASIFLAYFIFWNRNSWLIKSKKPLKKSGL